MSPFLSRAFDPFFAFLLQRGTPAGGGKMAPADSEPRTGSATPSALITGGAGFVGSNLGKALHALGYRVTVLDDFSYGTMANLESEAGGDKSPFCRVVRASVCSPGIAPEFRGVDVVFHLAGIAALPVCQERPDECISVNVAGTANVLNCARLAGVRRVVFSSTSAVYENSGTSPHCEADPVSPDLVYSLSKAHAEDLCRSFANNYGMDVVIARFFNVHGPNQDILRQSPPLTSYLSVMLARGLTPVLYNNRDDIKRDYVHVDDVVALLVAAARAPGRIAAEVVNVGSGTQVSISHFSSVCLLYWFIVLNDN